MHHWPRSSIFVSQGIYSLMRPRRPVGADQDGPTTVCATPLSSRPRIQKSCGLTALERHRGLLFFPFCSRSCRSVVNRYVRPPAARRRCPKKHSAPTRSAPTRARLARDSSEGEWPVFFCLFVSFFNPWGSFLIHLLFSDLTLSFFPPGKRQDSFARWAPPKERVPPPEPHGHVGHDRDLRRSV